MKRCDNCGWYNPDHLHTCEKCDEPLGEPLKEEAPAQAQQPEEPAPIPVAAHPMAQTEPKITEPEKASGRIFSATMRDTRKVKEILEDKAPGDCPNCGYPISGNPESCPNCGTPLRRSTRKDATSYSAPEPTPAPEPVKVAPAYNATVRDIPTSSKPRVAPAYNATVRDIPTSSKPRVAPAYNATVRDVPSSKSAPASNPAGPGVFRLVPVSDSSSPIVYLSVGDVVTINGKIFRFEK